MDSWLELKDYANTIQHSNQIHQEYQGKPANILLAIQYGAMLGMNEIQSVKTIIPMGGYFCILNETKREIIQESQIGYFEEEQAGSFTKGDYVYKIRGFRGDKLIKEITFTREMYLQADLLVPKQIYDDMKDKLSQSQIIRYKYPERCIQMIASGWLFRDVWPDLFHGIRTIEEVMHYNRGEFALSPDGKGIVQIDTKAKIENIQAIEEKVLKTDYMQEIAPKEKETAEDDKFMADDVRLPLDQLRELIIKDHYTEAEIIGLANLGKSGRHYLYRVCKAKGFDPDLLPGMMSPKRLIGLIMSHQSGKEMFKTYITSTFGNKKYSGQDVYEKFIQDSIAKDNASGNVPRFSKKKKDNPYNIVVTNYEEDKAHRSTNDTHNLWKKIREMHWDGGDKDFKLLMKKLEGGDQYKNLMDLCHKAPVDFVNAFLNIKLTTAK